MEDRDKELLELAANAIGVSKYRYGDAIYPLPHVWNPLTDDGDALRLAVKLKISVGNYGCGCESVSIDGSIHCDEFNEDNPYAATRRAIVRAAAEIGKQKE